MSRFSEGMIEDGFSDSMEYMDHLEREADEWSSKIDNSEDEEIYDDEDEEDKKHSDHIDHWLCKQILKVKEIEEEFTRLWDQRVELSNIDKTEYDCKRNILEDELVKRLNVNDILKREKDKKKIEETMIAFDVEFRRIENEVHLEVNPLIKEIDERLEKLKYYYHPGKDFSDPELYRKDLMYRNPVSDFLLKFKVGDKVRVFRNNNNYAGIISNLNWRHGGVHVISKEITFQNPIHPVTDPDIRIEFA